MISVRSTDLVGHSPFSLDKTTKQLSVCPTPTEETNYWKNLWPPQGRGREYYQKNWVGDVQPTSQNPYPIYDQNLQYSLPYLGPD